MGSGEGAGTKRKVVDGKGRRFKGKFHQHQFMWQLCSQICLREFAFDPRNDLLTAFYVLFLLKMENLHKQHAGNSACLRLRAILTTGCESDLRLTHTPSTGIPGLATAMLTSSHLIRNATYERFTVEVISHHRTIFPRASSLKTRTSYEECPKDQATT